MIGTVLGWLEDHQGLASWAQAAGTVAAIGFALFLPRWERRQREQATAMSLRLPLRQAWFAMEGAHEYARRERADTPAKEKTLRELAVAIERLGHVPLHSLSTSCADATSFIRDKLSLMVELLSENPAGEAWTRENADFLKGEVDQGFRDLYRASREAQDVEIVTHIREG